MDTAYLGIGPRKAGSSAVVIAIAAEGVHTLMYKRGLGVFSPVLLSDLSCYGAGFVLAIHHPQHRRT